MDGGDPVGTEKKEKSDIVSQVFLGYLDKAQ